MITTKCYNSEMKQFTKFALAAAVFASSSLANAHVITTPLEQTYTPSTSFATTFFNVTTTTPFTYTFDFTDAFYGYIAGSDTIETASLSVQLYDRYGGNETYKFLLNSDTFLNDTDTPNGRLYDKLPITGAFLSNLSKDGKITLTVSSSSGTFQVGAVTLNVVETRDVPEPLSLSLIGVGLAGMVFMRRRKA